VTSPAHQWCIAPSGPFIVSDVAGVSREESLKAAGNVPCVPGFSAFSDVGSVNRYDAVSEANVSTRARRSYADFASSPLDAAAQEEASTAATHGPAQTGRQLHVLSQAQALHCVPGLDKRCGGH